jgi:hypothetical protein
MTYSPPTASVREKNSFFVEKYFEGKEFFGDYL